MKQLLLSDVNSILEVLQSVVSKSFLSTSKSKCPEEIQSEAKVFPVISCFANVINFVREGSVSIPQGLVKQFLEVATILKIVKEEDVRHEDNEYLRVYEEDLDEEGGVGDEDLDEDILDNLWWDENSHQYQLYWGEDDTDEEDDEDVFVTELSDEDESDYSVAHRVKARRARLGATTAEEVRLPPPPCSPSPTSPSPMPRRRTETTRNPMITALLRTIHYTAPKAVFSSKRSEILKKERNEERIANIIPGEFRSLWDSAENEDDAKNVNKSLPPDPYPTLDWSKVNSRFLNNIPKPSHFPKHGCSLDPAIYEWTEKVTKTHQCGEVFTSKQKVHPKFEDNFPFGHEWGYRTNAGIISVSNVAHHGYVWDDGNWVLHAQPPRNQENNKKTSEDGKFHFKKKVEGKRKLHRTWPPCQT